AAPGPLRSLVAAALTKDPDRRPTAGQLLDQLTGSSMAASARVQDSPTQTILAQTWQQAGPRPGSPGAAGGAVRSNGSLLLPPGPPGARPPGARSPGPHPPAPPWRGPAGPYPSGPPVFCFRGRWGQPGPAEQAGPSDRRVGAGRRGRRG